MLEPFSCKFIVWFHAEALKYSLSGHLFQLKYSLTHHIWPKAAKLNKSEYMSSDGQQDGSKWTILTFPPHFKCKWAAINLSTYTSTVCLRLFFFPALDVFYFVTTFYSHSCPGASHLVFYIRHSSLNLLWNETQCESKQVELSVELTERHPPVTGHTVGFQTAQRFNVCVPAHKTPPITNVLGLSQTMTKFFLR